MPGELLLDTGAFVALVDRSEDRHNDCVAVLEGWRGLVLTTEPILTETLHLVGPRWRAQEICLDFFLRGAFVLIPTSRATLVRAAALMEQYQDVPMDYADATLVALAEDVSTNLVFTLDRRGFLTYRIRGKKPFEIAPS
ncbi:MAG: type II toxin-antitoxin system VapC family toxin [Gammaproteobacteria bacterium]